jgi:hypothetical protein
MILGACMAAFFWMDERSNAISRFPVKSAQVPRQQFEIITYRSIRNAYVQARTSKRAVDACALVGD